MECPHCKKEIAVETQKSWLNVFILNGFVFMMIIGFVSGLLDNYTKIPLSVEDGLNANYYMLPMLFVGVFYMIYSGLYVSGKVKGKLLIHHYLNG